MITISPYVPVAEFERRARAWIARDGVAVFAVMTADGRQRAQLRRLRARLLDDSALWVVGGSPHPDGTTYLIAFPAGQRHAGWWGGPKGVEEDDPGGVEVEILGDLPDSDL